MKKAFKRALLGAVSVAILAGCASEEDTIIMAPLPQVESQFVPNLKWSTSDDGVGHYFSKLSPTISDDTLFVASRDGLVRALDPENGKPKWQADLGKDEAPRLSGGMTAAYGNLYIGSENGDVIALDQDTGEVIWRVKVSGEVLAKPIADSGLIIINTSQGILVALDESSGKERWALSTEVPSLTLRGDSTPVAIGGGVFWGTANGRLAAAIVERGQLIWQQPVGTPKGATEIDRLVDVDSSPLILGGTLFTVGYNGQLIAIDLRSANPIWKRNYSSANDLATDGQRIFVITEKDHIAAVDARSGTELWQNAKLENRQLTAPVVIDRYLVVGDSLGYLHWLDRTTGEFIAQQFVDDSGFAVGPVALSDGYVITTRNGNVKKLSINE
ncbi:outer membrane protein assembly factor BamB [Vibrio sagamiensis]|uniref:Outer membrane protein assembly factor BamB n=1 Tax=Vibrio sagamiensis NBRC 104589 TaxID=1219064 RepID=A0A511QGU7_9VIBR|nr:outer membrane protein assembly factor BamB [Vibrio sagamiensis]PNQ70604.1 outer membrane protein assembly factor BamB [Vibrio agarivorans]GEM76533.1 outer membrane protein assembly factor BamB [Vibrio sagamiensis NBRC 104589]